MPIPLPPLRSLGDRPTTWTRSPQWREGRFRNRRTTRNVDGSSTGSLARDALTKRGAGRPTRTVPLAPTDLSRPADGSNATWFGHSSVLVEIDGIRVLTDPVWGDRVSPLRRIGPRRLHPAPIPLDALPDLDAVVVSHDHYDHLDQPTVEWLARHRDPVFVVPLGVAAHLRRWEIPAGRIIELDWGEVHRAGDLTLVCTEAQHFSGRWLDRDRTLWCSWVIDVGGTRVWFGGDTGAFPGLADIGREHGPFDLTLMPVGAYDPRWRDVHLDPEEAVDAHRDLRADGLLPIHWATFDLAFHPWAEPMERLLEAAGDDVRVLTPRPGERLGFDAKAMPWW